MTDPYLDPPLDEIQPKAGAPGSLLWASPGTRLLIAGVAFQLLVLLAMVAIFARPHVDPGSRVVWLKVVPVDPRDLLRGDYVILSYDVSRAASGRWGPEPAGTTVYVALAPDPDGRHYHGDGVSEAPPNDGRPFLRGTLSGRGLIEFGIESYYVQEGEGLAFEAAARERRLSAEVVIAPDGVAALKRLEVGEPEG